MRSAISSSKRLLDDSFYVIPRAILVSVFLIYAALSILSYFDYFEAYLYPLRIAQGTMSAVGKNVYMGPYPHHQELEELKMRYKVDTVISLLDSDLPQERALYERECEESNELSLKVVSFPMHYWSFATGTRDEQNELMLKRIMELIKSNPNKKFYIHCYLGRHRVGFVREALKRSNVLIKSSGSLASGK